MKSPAASEGVVAVEAMIAEGRRINITLIISLARNAQVIEADAWLKATGGSALMSFTRPTCRRRAGTYAWLGPLDLDDDTVQDFC